MVHTYVVKYSVIKGVAAAAACQSCRLMNIMAYALECDSAIKLNSTLVLWLAGESSMAGVFQCNLMGKRMIVFVHLRAAEIILILQQIGSVHQFKSHQWEVSRAPPPTAYFEFNHHLSERAKRNLIRVGFVLLQLLLYSPHSNDT